MNERDRLLQGGLVLFCLFFLVPAVGAETYYYIAGWGSNIGGSGVDPVGIRRDPVNNLYCLVDSIGMEAASLGLGDLPYLQDESDSYYHGYSHVLFTSLDISAPSQPGLPLTESPTKTFFPTWGWAASTDNAGGTGLLTESPYRIYWSQVEGGEDYSDNAPGNSFTHQAALSLGNWYFKVFSLDQAGNRSGVSSNGMVEIVSITPPPTPSTTPTVVPTPSITPTGTPSITPTPTPTPSSSVTSTPIPSPSVTPTSTTTPSSTPTPPPSVTPTPLDLPQSAQYILYGWGLNGGGCGNFIGEKRQDSNYCLIDSLGSDTVSIGSDGGPYLESGPTRSYFDALFSILDTSPPGSCGLPVTDSPTYSLRPSWVWNVPDDNPSGSGICSSAGYRVFWSRDEAGEDNSTWADTNSYSHEEDLALGVWYFKVLAADREGNLSLVSLNGMVLIVTPSPSPIPSMTPTVTPTETPTATPSATPSVVPTVTPDGACQIDLKIFLHGYLNEVSLVQREAVVNVEFRPIQDQVGNYAFDLNLDSSGRTGLCELWQLPPNSYYLLVRHKLAGTTFDGTAVLLGANHYPVVSSEPRDFALGAFTAVNFADSAAGDYLGVYASDHPQSSYPLLAVGTEGVLWMVGGGNADGNDLINVADILKWDTLVGFPDSDDRGEVRFSDQGNFDGNDKIDGYDFNVWKRMVNEGVTYAPLP